jgi:signal recognition particle receptor subunit beta
MAVLLGNTLEIRVVYCGAPFSGKTTSLLALHEQLSAELKGDVLMLETDDDRTLFFDSFPVGLIAPSGLKVRVKVFSVPGQQEYRSTRRAILSGADGAIFVVDGRPDIQGDNDDAYQDLQENLAFLELHDELPVAIECNKSDLLASRQKKETIAYWAERSDREVHPSCALKGKGVIEPFIDLLDAIYERLDAEFSLSSDHALTADEFTGRLAAFARQEAS